MPNRILTNADTFNSLSTWLDENLNNQFRANSNYLPADENSRGIYFWFMKPVGYQKLSELGLNITAINPTYKKVINSETYDLVYIGTAGANRKESNTLFKRLNWHLSDKHNENNICHGTISTLRHTVGSALSDDLIIPNTENDVNEFFSDYFYVYVLPYLGEANTKEQIDNDEYYLISVLKPLFNIKNNPNARITAGQHPTRQLKVRRGLVMNNTRERLGCKKGNDGKAKSKKDDNKPPTSPENNYELIYDKDGCQEFTVSKDQSVHDVVSGIEGLPNGKCEIVIYDSANPKTFIYTSKHNKGKRVTGNKEISIYGYFSNIDTNRNNQPRWKVIQQEMLDKGIEEITVRVCSDELNESDTKAMKKKGGSPQNNTIKSDKIGKVSVEEKEILDILKDRINDEPVLLILSCSDTKVSGGTESKKNYFESYECLENKRKQVKSFYEKRLTDQPNTFKKKRNGESVDDEYFKNTNGLMIALERYRGGEFYKKEFLNKYKKLIESGKLHLLILSGLYGILHWRDTIIDYHLEFKNKRKFYKNSDCIKMIIKKYMEQNGIKEQHTFYAVSPSSKYEEIITPNNWNHIWIKGGRSKNTANFLLQDFLENL